MNILGRQTWMRGKEALCPRYFRDSDDRDKHVADYKESVLESTETAMNQTP